MPCSFCGKSDGVMTGLGVWTCEVCVEVCKALVEMGMNKVPLAALQRQKGSAGIYRRLWLAAEQELVELRTAQYGEIIGIELDLGNEVGEELERLAYEEE